MRILINLNDNVQVTLTAYGAKVANEDVQKYSDRQPYAPGQVVRMQLHALANIFGPKLCPGFENCFEGNDITLLEGGL
jgi:hypothetical protein